jgi:hypothetical protein
MSVKTTVGQVALVGGGWYDQPSNILVDERAGRIGRGRGRGNLYVVVEVTGPAAGRDLIARQLIETLRQVYYGRRGSVTAGLRAAIREANTLLLEENRTSLPGERSLAGVSCAVLRDDDLFLGQLGPAAVYLLCEGRPVRFPERSSWLDDIPPEEMDAVHLGERHDINVDLYHSKISTGDTFLLADSNLARSLSLAAWPDILARTPTVDVLEQVYNLSDMRDVSMLLVRVGEEATEPVQVQPEVPPPAPVVQPERAVPAAPPEPLAERLSAEEMPVEPTVLAGPSAPAEQPAVLPEPPTEHVVPAEAEPQEKSPPALAQVSAAVASLRLGERLGAAGAAVVATLAALGAGLLSLFKRVVPDRSAAQQQPVARTSTVKTTQKKPPRRPKARGAADLQSVPVQRLLVGVAIAIPVIVGLIVLVAWIQRGQAQRAELDLLWQQASTHWQQAQSLSDPELARTELAEAQRYLELLLASEPDHAEALDLHNSVQARLDVINQVQRVSWVGELNSYPTNADLTRVVVQGAHLFVMDRHNGQVYHHQLDPQLQNALDPGSTDTVLVSTGDQVGEVLVGDLVDMVWMPTGPNRQKASLIILESGGALLDYDPATRQLLPLNVAAYETWQFPDLVGSHSGRFYVLDSSANQILRYSPTPDGYTAPPEPWLQTEVDLAGTEDMAIGDSIYLIYADGAILKFSRGEPDTFDISDWDVPPRSPSAIFTRPPDETRYIYVADRGNSRIVQASKEGQFRQQFRLADDSAAENGDPLASATSLFVDEISGYAYLLSGQELYLLILPMSQ